MSSDPRQGLHTARLLEGIEMAALRDLYLAAPPDVTEALGLHSAWIDGALAISATRMESLLFNRVVGVGVFEPASAETLDAVRGFYPEGFGHAINLAPFTEPAALADDIQARGNATFFHHVKWSRGPEPAATAASELRIARVTSDQALAYGRVCAAVFGGGSEPMARWSAAQVGRPGWTNYLAFDGETPVSCAALHVSANGAWFGGAGTLKSARGKGAQSALLAARITDAVAAGATTLVVETGPGWPELDPVSYRNVGRAGFQVAYERPSWIYPVPTR